MTDKRNPKRIADTAHIGDVTHDSRKNGASNNGHHQERGAELCVWSEMLEAQGKDGREHDRMKEPEQDQSPHRRHSSSKQQDREADQSRHSEKREQAGSRDALHDRGAGKSAN